jgi:hypothetical protein
MLTGKGVATVRKNHPQYGMATNVLAVLTCIAYCVGQWRWDPQGVPLVISKIPYDCKCIHTYIHTYSFTDPSSTQVGLNVEFITKTAKLQYAISQINKGKR